MFQKNLLQSNNARKKILGNCHAAIGVFTWTPWQITMGLHNSESHLQLAAGDLGSPFDFLIFEHQIGQYKAHKVQSRQQDARHMPRN